MWIRCKPTNPVPKCFFVCGAASHTQEKVFLIRPMWRNVWMRGTEWSSQRRCESILCVPGIGLCRNIWPWIHFFCFSVVVFLWVWVGRRPPAPHNQDTGLSGGSYSPFPKLLSQQAVPNVLFSPHISSSLSFYSSVCVFFFFFLISASSHTLFSLTVSSLRFLLASSLFSIWIFLSFRVARWPLTSHSWVAKRTASKHLSHNWVYMKKTTQYDAMFSLSLSVTIISNL